VCGSSKREPAVIVVERPGLRTTVQDLGRFGYAYLGVPRSGAADSFSLRLANVLVGNPFGHAVLETTLVGPALRFRADAVVAVTGAPAPIAVDGESRGFGRSFAVAAGQLLEIGRAAAGLRSYVAVAGGVDVPPVLGSRSFDTLSNLGPPPLVRDMALPIGATGPVAPGLSAPAAVVASVLRAGPVRVVRGPTPECFSGEAWHALRAGAFSVSTRSDRVGVSLRGPSIGRRRDQRSTTIGMVAGAIQVPPDGNPVVLLADHAVTGGYPVVAVVISADLPLIAQARPGASLRFAEVTVDEAAAAWADVEALYSRI
jgi:biotin-dependent carboxylase-like uncharacterized protein